MEVKFNANELNVKTVNSYLFFNYLAINLNNAETFFIGDFYNLLIDIKNNKFKNILAEFKHCETTSKIIDLCYYYYKTDDCILTIINDHNKMLIKLSFANSEINLIINNFNKDYNILKFINDYLDYETEMLDNE